MRALAGHCITTTEPFRERLVLFWANHFSVSLRRSLVAVFAGDYLRQAIRPHLGGRFADMLLAALRHPAMLAYLDQTSSIGPNSRDGLQRRRGLNENLAREALELHTVSPAAGYTQADVTEFARLLTGLGISMQREPLGTTFSERNHEPGDRIILGQRFAAGEDQIEEVKTGTFSRASI